MTNADSLLLERLVARAENQPHDFSIWELDRLREWEGRTDLSPAQVAILTRIDVVRS